MDNFDVKLSIDEVAIELSKEEEIATELSKEEEIAVELEQENDIDVNLNEIRVVMPKYHNDLLGLDYEHSGHTGFASEGRLSLLEQKVEEEVVPKRLSLLPELSSNADRKRVTLYADYENQSYKVTMDKIGAQIKTVQNRPADMQVGDYIFLEKGE